MWHDIVAEGEPEYNNWHTHEHMPERVGVPGFLVGRRYVDWSLPKYRYFTLYEGRTLETFKSAPYLARLNEPTAWTKRIQPHFRNMVRAACVTLLTTGRGVGGALLTARVDFADGGRTAFAAAAPQLAERLGAAHGVIGVHMGVADPSITNVNTSETELRKATPEAVYDAVVLIEGIGRHELEHVARSGVADLVPAVARVDVAVYDLAYLLTSESVD